MHRSREWLYERIRGLRLPAFPERLVEIAASARLEHASYKQFVLQLSQGADAAIRLSGAIAHYSAVDRLFLDRFGHLILNVKGAEPLFQIFTEREEGKATAAASNAPISEWDKAFADPRLCAAIADRISFKGALIQTGAYSHLLKVTENENEYVSSRRS